VIEKQRLDHDLDAVDNVIAPFDVRQLMRQDRTLVPAVKRLA
jgi:hypothetical protein